MVVVAAFAVAAIEIDFHWLLGNGQHALLLAVYLEPDRGGKTFTAG